MSLIQFIKRKDYASIRKVVEENKSCVNETDEDGKSPLMICCCEEEEKWALGVAIMILQQTNTNTSVRDENNMDMMMYACLFERVHLFNLFTKAFTLKIDRKDKYGNTSLHYAVMSGNKEITASLVQIMVNKKANFEIRNVNGNTPFDLIPNTEIHQVFSDQNLSEDKSCDQPMKICFGKVEIAENLESLRRQIIKSLNRNKISEKAPTVVRNDFSKAAVNSRTKQKKKSKTKKRVKVLPNEERDPTNKNWREVIVEIQCVLNEQIAASFRPSAKPIVEEPFDSEDDFFLDDFTPTQLRQRAKSMYPGMDIKHKLRSLRRDSSLLPGLSNKQKGSRRDSDLQSVDLNSIKAKSKRRESVDPSLLKKNNFKFKPNRRSSLITDKQSIEVTNNITKHEEKQSVFSKLNEKELEVKNKTSAVGLKQARGEGKTSGSLSNILETSNESDDSTSSVASKIKYGKNS